MSDLVSEDAGELRFRVEQIQEAARNEDVAAGKCNCVRRGNVDDLGLPRAIRPLTSGGQAQRDVRDVYLPVRIVDAADLLHHLTGRLPAHRDLLVFGEQGELTLARDGIDGATPEHGAYAACSEGEPD